MIIATNKNRLSELSAQAPETPHLRALFVVLVVVAACPGILIAQAACQRAVPDPSPTWTASAAWSDTESLVLIDISARSLVEYDLVDSASGKAIGRSQLLWGVAAEKGFLNGKSEVFTPTKIRESDDDYFVISDSPGSDATVWALSEDFGFLGAASLGNAEGADGSIQALYDFSPIGSSAILAFGDVKADDGSWRTGFLRVESGFKHSFDEIRTYNSIPRYDGDLRYLYKAYYILGRNMICSEGQTAHALDLYESPSLLSVRADGTASVLGLGEILPYGNDVEEPSWVSPSFVDMLRSASSNVGPEGVYCWNGRVFLLIREPGIDDGFSWVVARVDLDQERVDGTWVLPTDAAHVFLAPGPDYLAVVSKGHARKPLSKDSSRQLELPYQPIEHIDLVPISVFEDSQTATVQGAQPICGN